MDENLIKQVALLTGLPNSKVETVIKNWIVESGRSPQDIGLEDLKEVLISLVQGLFNDVAQGTNEYITLSQN